MTTTLPTLSEIQTSHHIWQRVHDVDRELWILSAHLDLELGKPLVRILLTADRWMINYHLH